MTNNGFPYREDEYTTDIVAETLSDGSVVYVASHPDFDGCMAHGNNDQEARANLAEAFKLAVAHLRRYNLPIPQPRTSRVQQIVWESFAAPGVYSAPTMRFILLESSTPVTFSQSNNGFVPEWVRANLYLRAMTGSIGQAVVQQSTLEPAG